MVARTGLIAALAGLCLLASGCTADRATAPPAIAISALQTAHQGDAFHAMLASSRDLGLLPPSRAVSALLLLRDPTRGRLQADLAAAYRPGSSHFGQFSSARQYAIRYGPRPASVGRLRARLALHGLRLTWHPGDTSAIIRGEARDVDSLLAVSIHLYRTSSGHIYYASPRDPTLPYWMRSAVSGAGRISSYFPLRPALIPDGGFSPADLRIAYDIKQLRDRGIDGSGQTVAIFSDGYSQKDLDTFARTFHLPPLHPEVRLAPGLKTQEGEAEMDMEVIHAIAPAARIRVYNFDTSNINSDQDYASALFNLQGRMVNENPHGIISESFGICDAVLGRTDVLAYRDLYDKAARLGEAVFASTGDEGAFECLSDADRGTPPSQAYIGVPIPASEPGVTAAGGTKLSVRSDMSWKSETVWEQPTRTGGTGGGISRYIPQPLWQVGPGASANPSNPRHMRMVPDIAADADPISGMQIYTQGSWGLGGGTSQAAPLWAGMTALINQYLKGQGLHLVGSLNPALYRLASRPQPYPPFHDVTLGTNLVYPAGSHYDMASGLGTPDAWNLARDLAGYVRRGGR